MNSHKIISHTRAISPPQSQFFGVESADVRTGGLCTGQVYGRWSLVVVVLRSVTRADRGDGAYMQLYLLSY
jgi:hypothetical protein